MLRYGLVPRVGRGRDKAAESSHPHAPSGRTRGSTKWCGRPPGAVQSPQTTRGGRMVDCAFPPLSLQGVVQAMPMPLHSPHRSSMVEQVNAQGTDELGLYDNWIEWRGTLHEQLQKAYPFFDQFYTRYQAFSDHYQQRRLEDARRYWALHKSAPPGVKDQPDGVMEAFLHQELEVFIHQP